MGILMESLMTTCAKIYDGPNLSLNPRTDNISLNEYMRRHR